MQQADADPALDPAPPIRRKSPRGRVRSSLEFFEAFKHKSESRKRASLFAAHKRSKRRTLQHRSERRAFVLFEIPTLQAV
jgi:hypothetical protein